MKFKFSDIEFAYEFVNPGFLGENYVLIRKDIGEILYQSDAGDLDDIGDEEKLPMDQCVWIPGKNDLDFGKHLVIEFMYEYFPEKLDRVEDFFRRKGAYGRFKDLLDDHGQLENRYKFESEAQEKALRQWCSENGIELSDEPGVEPRPGTCGGVIE